MGLQNGFFFAMAPRPYKMARQSPLNSSVKRICFLRKMRFLFIFIVALSRLRCFIVDCGLNFFHK